MKTPYYVFYANDFIQNYKELETAFRSFYPDYYIAYSFKTNYTPAVCKLVRELGGYAEVVSDMEFELARRVGFATDRIIYNGPGKEQFILDCMKGNGLLNIDNFSEINRVFSLMKEQKDCRGYSVGIRVNFDIGNGLHSRFGIDAINGDLDRAVTRLADSGIIVNGIHFHISRARGIDAWKRRIDILLQVADKVEGLQNRPIEYIDIGSGMFGKLGDELKKQFPDVPSYFEYAKVVAGTMAEHYAKRERKPLLFTEPGTTLVSRYFSLFTTVLDIKRIRDKHFALLDCSVHNVGEICGLKKVPMRVIKEDGKAKDYDRIDLVGYTCLEQDVIYHDYCGRVGVGDVIEFSNVGGYSIVDKPPFIHPDIPIYMEKNGECVQIKRAQTIDDIFAPYAF